MATMVELATQYRQESAKLAIHIREREASGAPRWETEIMKTMLRETRRVQRVLMSYYDTPRDSYYTMANLYAPKRSYDTDN